MNHREGEASAGPRADPLGRSLAPPTSVGLDLSEGVRGGMPDVLVAVLEQGADEGGGGTGIRA